MIRSERQRRDRASTRLKLARQAIAIAAALSVAACASISPPQQTSSLPAPVKRSENQVGAPSDREHHRILAAYGGAYEDAKLEALLNGIVDRLSAASERPDLRYRVTILNSPSVNAFALGTGQLYVTRGLLALANDTAELASVLSHEMSHVVAQHASIREDHARQAAIVSRVVSDVLNDPKMGALALAKSKIALASFSRSQEFEADEMGVKVSARAGFDPYGAARFLSSMGRNAELRSGVGNSGREPSPDFLSSHPSTPERVKNAQRSARDNPSPGEREREGYLALLDGMTFGDDPSEGFVRGRRFLHPKLGFTFIAPEGFMLENTAQAVLGLTASGDDALRLDVIRLPTEQSLTEYLVSGWIENVDPRSVEETNIGGFAAASATAIGEQWTFRVTVVRFGTDIYRFIFGTKRHGPQVQASFDEAVRTFRRMTLAEMQGARPVRLRLLTVAAGDTLEKLAARMSVHDRALDRFLVLNGLAPGQTPKPGEQVKVLVD